MMPSTAMHRSRPFSVQTTVTAASLSISSRNVLWALHGGQAVVMSNV